MTAFERILAVGVPLLWACYFLLLRQQQEAFQKADPEGDTGVSFGLAFMESVVPSALLILCAIMVGIALEFRTRRKKREKG